jgi:tRNA A37 N6-isopentenylltransferase MiaA
MIAWRKPAVYAWIRDGAVLYVGKAGSGIARPCSPQHEAITTDAIHSGDTIAIWACRASSEALFEQHLIDHLKPSRNRAVTRWAGEALAVHDKYSREGKKHARRLSHEDR